MFKKSPQPKAAANIKSSDRRRLLADICVRFHVPKERLEKAAELALLPLIVKQATYKSPQNYSGTIYYDENETPLWFKSRDSAIYPSLFTLWRNPYLVPLVRTHPHVIGILAGGADLMLPGTVPPFDERITFGTVVGVVSTDEPTVVKAVGVSQMDLKSIQKVVGTTGAAVNVLHAVGDELCNLNKLVDIDVPTALDLAPPWDQIEIESGQIEQVEQIEPEAQPTPVDSTTDLSDLADSTSQLTLDEIDHFFVRALLQALKLDSLDLPINASNFMANHVYRNLPVLDASLKNIKKTSWKKTGKFLRQMAKLNYIQVKGKDDDLIIVSVMPKTHKTLEDFVTHKTEPKPKPKSAESKSDLSLVQLYQPTTKYRMFFNRLDAQYDAVYTLNDLKSLVNDYIKKADLVVPSNPKLIKVDDILGAIISGSPIARGDIMAAFIKHLRPKYVILKPGQDIGAAKIEDGALPKIEIICETKIGRKTVTRVKNFEKFYIKPHIIMEDLRVLCSGSTTSDEDKGLTEVTVQGPHHKTIVDYLRSKGVPNNRIDYEDKSKKKKRRT